MKGDFFDFADLDKRQIFFVFRRIILGCRTKRSQHGALGSVDANAATPTGLSMNDLVTISAAPVNSALVRFQGLVMAAREWVAIPVEC